MHRKEEVPNQKKEVPHRKKELLDFETERDQMREEQKLDTNGILLKKGNYHKGNEKGLTEKVEGKNEEQERKSD